MNLRKELDVQASKIFLRAKGWSKGKVHSTQSLPGSQPGPRGASTRPNPDPKFSVGHSRVSFCRQLVFKSVHFPPPWEFARAWDELGFCATMLPRK